MSSFAKKLHLYLCENTRFWSYHNHYAFQQKFFVDVARWNLDASKEAVNCKTKQEQQVCCLFFFAYKNFKSTKKRITFDVEIEVF